MQRLIQRWLKRSPPVRSRLAETKYIVMDGTFLQGRSESVVLVLDGETGIPVLWEYGAKETEKDLKELFQAMKERGCMPKAATIDGNPALSRALKTVWPSILIQRCLVHIRRQGDMWCRAKPKRKDAIHLKDLLQDVLLVNTHEEKELFFRMWEEWNGRFGVLLAQDKERGWIQSDLKRAQSMLEKAIPYMFMYLEDSKILSTTNMAEGCISRLKALLRDHRGLRKSDRRRAVNWFLSMRS